MTTNRNIKLSLLFCSLFCSAFFAYARGVYQSNEAFISQTFAGSPPTSKILWIKADLRTKITEIINRKYQGLRIRYWQDGKRSAWIFNEIGKEQPITFGVIVNDSKIETIKILAYRESRGEEIRHPAFIKQLINAQLNEQQLDRTIDGVSGATLSVNAMTAVAKLALYLDQMIQQ